MLQFLYVTSPNVPLLIAGNINYVSYVSERTVLSGEARYAGEEGEPGEQGAHQALGHEPR